MRKIVNEILIKDHEPKSKNTEKTRKNKVLKTLFMIFNSPSINEITIAISDAVLEEQNKVEREIMQVGISFEVC